MKRQHKLLAFVLTVTLLLSSFVIPTTTASASSANSASFVSSANTVKLPSSGSPSTTVKNTIDLPGSMTNYIVTNQVFGTNATLATYIVESDDRSYIMLSPSEAAVSAGAMSQHSYLEFQVNSQIQKNTQYDYRYYVLEIDIATESKVLPINPQIVSRLNSLSGTGSFGAEWAGAKNGSASEYVNMTPGEFHHYTFIGDIYTNTLYIYINNVLVQTNANGVMSAADHTNVYNAGNFLFINGLRFGVTTSGAPITENMSLALDNLNQRMLTESDAGNLVSYAGQASLQGWDKNTYTVGNYLGSLPSLVAVNDKEYNNIIDANMALDNVAGSNTVNARRALYSGTVEVNCNSTIYTHGLDFPLKAGANATLTELPQNRFESKLTSFKHFTTVDNENATTLGNDYIYTSAENKITSLSQTTAPANTMQTTTFVQKDGNKYATYYALTDSSGYPTSTAHVYYNAGVAGNGSAQTTLLSNFTQVVFEVDLLSDYKFVNFYTNFNIRNSETGGPLPGNKVYFNDIISAAEASGISIPTGEWLHFTFVGDVASGNADIYMNGQFIMTAPGILWNHQTISELDSSHSGVTVDESNVASYAYLQSVRTLQVANNDTSSRTLEKSMSVSSDNYYLGYISDADVYSKAARTSSSWSIYSEDYEFPMRDPIATIDGVEYYSLVDMAEALNADYGNTESNGHIRKVIFFRDYFGDLNISCRATIDENSAVSRNGSFIYASDTTNETVDGLIEVYKLTNTFGERSDAEAVIDVGNNSNNYVGVAEALKAPNKKTDGDGITYVTTSDGDDNLYAYHYSGNIKDNREVYVTTVTDINGKQYTVLKETGGTGHTDIYSLSYKLSKEINQYFFIEIDMAYMGVLSPSFMKEDLGVYLSAYKIDSNNKEEFMGKTFEIKMSDVLNGKVGSEFSHVTIIGSVYDEKVYTFVDNKLVNIYDASETFGDEEGYTYKREFRLMFFPRATNGETMLYDNAYMGIHTVTDAVRSDINASVASGTLQGKYAINTESYEYPTYATKYLAVVDGEYFLEGQEMALAEALTKYSDEPIKVEFLSEPQSKITIKGNANIDTNGMDLSEWIVADTSNGFSAETTGNTTTITGPIPSNKLTDTLESSSEAGDVYNAVKYQPTEGMTANTFSSIYLQNYFVDGSHKLHIMKNESTGDLYAYDSFYNRDNLPSSSGVNPYAEFMNSDHTAYKGKGQFIVVDGDFAFDRYDGVGKFFFNTRNKDGNLVNVSNYIYVDTMMQEAGIPVGTFAHVTMVGFIETGSVYVYVNGKLIGSKPYVLYDSNGYGEGYYLRSVRYGQGVDLELSYDNIYIRVVDDSAVTTPESFIGSREDIYTAKKHTVTEAPVLATVDGIKYYSIDELEKALTSDTRVELEFHHVPTRPVNVNTLANINTNSLASQTELISIGAGFAKNTSASTGSYIVIDAQKNYGKLTIMIDLNGVHTTILQNVELLYGTSVKNYLTDNGYLSDGYVIAGSVWHGVTWSSAFDTSVINSASMTFVGTASGVITDDYILVNSDESFTTVSASDANCDELLRTHFSKGGDSKLILNRDWTVKHTLASDGETWNTIVGAPSGVKGIYLNNHSIIGDAELTSHTHGMVLDGSSAHITFYRGNMDFRALTTTQSFIFSGYNFSGSMKLKHIDIKVSSSLIQARSGNFAIEDCTVDAYLAASYSPLFQIGEDYNGNYTKTPISLSIKDSKVSHRYNVSYATDRYSSYSINTPMIKQRIITSGGAADPNHVIEITGSELLAQGSLVQANTTIDDAEATSRSNLSIRIKSSSVNAKDWASGSIKRTVITLSDDVRTNITDDSSVILGDNVRRARVSGSIHKYLYTTHDFASVTWSNGEQENWAAGSVPYNYLCKFDDISAVSSGVVAGEKYIFEESASAAPFKFYASLTLSDKIGFNLLIPDGFDVSKVIIDGHILAPSDAKAGESATVGGACTYYTVFFAPHEAGRSFNVSIILTDGTVMSRETSVGAYAKSLWEKVKDGKDLYSERNRALLSVALLYIEQATAYAGYHVDMTELSSVLTSAGLISNTPTGTDYTGTNETLASYIKSAQVSLRGTYAIRFNLASGISASNIIFYVDGKTASTTVGDGYVDVSIRAYDMNKDIEIYQGTTKLGTYNLYTYYTALSQLSGTQGGAQYENASALKLIRALWNYANTADQYLDAE